MQVVKNNFLAIILLAFLPVFISCKKDTSNQTPLIDGGGSGNGGGTNPGNGPTPNFSKSTELNSVFFVNTQVGWIAGKSGRLEKTEDGGRTWKNQNAVIGYNINGLFFVDVNNGWFVGDDGFLGRTTDGGETWQTSIAINKLDNYAVAFSDAGNGYYVGEEGALYYTYTAGRSWNKDFYSLFYDLKDVYGIFAVTSKSTVVVGEKGLLMYTTNGGLSWTKAGNTSEDLIGVHSADKVNFYILSDKNYVYKYHIGGTPERFELPAKFSPNAIHFTSAVAGFVAGDDGLVYRTTDGARTWTKVNVNTSKDLNAIQFPTPSVGHAVGEDGVIVTIQ